MKLVAVATVLNEADIIGTTVASLYANGVDEIHVALSPSDDGTREILEKFEVAIVEDDSPYHYQPVWINHITEMACEPGDWVIPFDADEMHYATEGGTIRDALLALPDVRNLHVRAYQHRDFDYRERNYRSLGKCAFRYEPGCWVANGNHSVHLPSGGSPVSGVLDLRELQFRSFEHLARKCRERVDRLDPTLPYTEGTHQRVLAALNENELRVEWARMQAVPVVWDPVPVIGG